MKTIQHFLLVLVLISSFQMKAQVDDNHSNATQSKHSLIAFGNYDAFFDTTAPQLTHSAVKPSYMNEIPVQGMSFFQKLTRTSETASNRTTHVFPVVNQIAAHGFTEDESTSFRSHVGIGGVLSWGEKWSLRGTITGGYYQRDSAVNLRNGVIPNTYFWNGTVDERFEVDPRFRLSYSPNKFFNLQVGIDHNYIGDGERSILLSDYSASHPFFKLRSSLWKFEFVNVFQFFRENVNDEFLPKYGSTHYLSYQVNKRFQFGVFESVTFQPSDTMLLRGYEWEYLNPFLFYRPTEYSIGSQDRLVLGTYFNYQLDNLLMYGQFLIDDFVLNELLGRTRWWSNKYAGQIGFKGKRKAQNTYWNYFAEVNFARPFTYTHLGPETNYANQGISLAHPLGANFAELYSGISVAFKNDLKLAFNYMFAQQGGFADDGENYGTDIYLSYANRPFEYGYFIGGHGQLNRYRYSLKISYPIVKKYAIEAFVQPIFEQQRGVINANHIMLFTGIRTNLWNERSMSF